MSETEYTLWYRISRAAMLVVFNVVLWVLIPMFLYGQLLKGLPSSPIVLTNDFIYTFGITITALQALGELTTGMALSVPFATGSYVAEAYYLWAAMNGGLLAFSAAGVTFSISFQTVLFLLMLAPLFSAVRAPIGYLLDESEASKPASDSV